MNYKIKAPDYDLETTMTCGQTFCWHRVEGDLYGEGESKFYTFRKNKPLIVHQEDDMLMVETELPRSEVEKALGLHHDLEEVFENLPDDQPIRDAREEYWGLRILQDEFLPCLISYICSSQMRIERIKEMFDEMCREFGEVVEYQDHELLKFPELSDLAEQSEEEFRELGVGYRAKYIEKTVEILQEEDIDPIELAELDYHDAKEEVKKLHGVGDKVADCVLLFSIGFYESIPFDTWIKKALSTHYPDLYSEDYNDASENMREYFGEHAGYAQEYLFHAARNNVIEVEE